MLFGGGQGGGHDVEALVQQIVADRERREEADHVAVGSAGEHDDALRVQAFATAAVSAASGRSVSGSTNSMAIIAPRPRTSPMRGSCCLDRGEAVGQDRADLACALDQAVVLEDVDRGERRGAGERVAAVGAAEAADVGGIHDLGAAGDGRERKPPAMPFAVVIRSGTMPKMLAGEQRAGAGEAGLHLIGDEDDAVRAAPLHERGEEAVGGNDEAALALDGLDDDRGEVLGADLLLDLRGSRAAPPRPSSPSRNG